MHNYLYIYKGSLLSFRAYEFSYATPQRISVHWHKECY